MNKKLINKDLFIDRATELCTLSQGLKNGTDYVIIVPRKYGKTTLVNKVFSDIGVPAWDPNSVT